MVLETPPGADSNRRQTRSQTRGTPPVVASPPVAKKIALEKSIASNGSVNKGRRGRPPRNAISTTDSEEMKVDPAKSDENVEKEVKNEQELQNSSPAPPQVSQEQKQQNEDKVDEKPKSLVNEVVSSPKKENSEVIKSDENEKKPEMPTVAVSELKNELSPNKSTITGTEASPINTTASPKQNKPVSSPNPAPVLTSVSAPAPSLTATSTSTTASALTSTTASASVSTTTAVSSPTSTPAPAPPIMVTAGLDKKQN